MFAAGDFVIYGRTGICEVMDVTTLDMEGVPSDRLYYVLRPDGPGNGKIFAPVENGSQPLRAIMTPDEAKQLIHDIPDIDPLTVPNDKLREETYKNCMRTCDNRNMVSMIKAIYFRKQERTARGKKITATDERYLKQAQDRLYSELSMLLSVPKDQMEDYIKENVEA